MRGTDCFLSVTLREDLDLDGREGVRTGGLGKGALGGLGAGGGKLGG